MKEVLGPGEDSGERGWDRRGARIDPSTGDFEIHLWANRYQVRRDRLSSHAEGDGRGRGIEIDPETVYPTPVRDQEGQQGVEGARGLWSSRRDRPPWG